MKIEYEQVKESRDATLGTIEALNALLDDPNASDLDKVYSAELVDHLIGIVEVSKKYLLFRDAADLGLSPHQYGVVRELSALDAKLDKLTRFLGSDTCAELNRKEQEDLEQQWRAMTEYHRILSIRIATYKEPHVKGAPNE